MRTVWSLRACSLSLLPCYTPLGHCEKASSWNVTIKKWEDSQGEREPCRQHRVLWGVRCEVKGSHWSMWGKRQGSAGEAGSIPSLKLWGKEKQKQEQKKDGMEIHIKSHSNWDKAFLGSWALRVTEFCVHFPSRNLCPVWIELYQRILLFPYTSIEHYWSHAL